MSKEKYNIFASANGVAIPLIQRDYVQGADANFEKRNKFLTKLLNALLYHTKCELHFIYGSKDNAKTDEPYFVPVDGQQRLTTIALIGWLLNQKSNLQYSSQLKPLTYTTRPSTEQFCARMREFTLPESYDSVSQYIMDNPGWFSESWKWDPSVRAMLELLNQVDSMLSEEPYSSKIDEMAETFFKNSPFEFESLDMEDLDLNDDLYVKMNARGKLLTPFENWKAEFEDFLEKNHKEVKYEYGNIPGFPAGEIPSLKEYFEYAIEHDWCEMLWPRAFKQWDKKSDEEKRKTLYPTIDRSFMNILDYVSQFLMFAAIEDVDTYFKKKGLKNARDLYSREIDKSRLEVYENAENIVILFRILDTLVCISKDYNGDFRKFMSRYFIATECPLRLPESDRFKVNLFEQDVDLITSCLECGPELGISYQIILWSVFQWLLNHPDDEKPDSETEKFTDYLRIITGWVRRFRQRLTNGYIVGVNVRLANYNEAFRITQRLSEAKDLFHSLTTSQEKTLEDEIEKGRLYGTSKFDIIRELSTCRSLYYSFNLLMPSIMATKDVESYIDRFYEFWNVSDTKRVQILNNHGFKGIRPLSDCWFYGMDGKWDFLFTATKADNGYNNAVDAFTAMMNGDDEIIFSPDKMAYYMAKYPNFVEAHSGDVMRHYFRHAINQEFTVWTIRSPKSKPWMGYNTDPYAYTVQSLYTSKGKTTYQLSNWSNYAEHGALYIRSWNANDDAMYIECYDLGWEIGIYDKRQTPSRKFFERFNEVTDDDDTIIGYMDTQGVFSFNGLILLDIPGKDRIESALEFLKSIE